MAVATASTPGWAAAFECAAACDLLLMIGSSLQVQPAASIPGAARQAGARLVFINRSSTPYDHLADVRFDEDAAQVLGDLMNAFHGKFDP